MGSRDRSVEVFLLFLGTVVVLSGIVLAAYLEASAYNRVTGKNVSTWDAIFLDLRVQSEPKE